MRKKVKERRRRITHGRFGSCHKVAPSVAGRGDEKRLKTVNNIIKVAARYILAKDGSDLRWVFWKRHIAEFSREELHSDEANDQHDEKCENEDRKGALKRRDEHPNCHPKDAREENELEEASAANRVDDVVGGGKELRYRENCNKRVENADTVTSPDMKRES